MSKNFLCLIAITVIFAGCDKLKDNTPLLAKSGGFTVTENEFVTKVKGLPRELQSVIMKRRKDFVEQILDEKFLAREAEKRGIAEQTEVKELIEQARKKIIIAKLVETEIDKKIDLSNDEAEKFYESHKEEFMTPMLLRASHILVNGEQEANAIKAQLNAGADFEELARTKSLDSTAIRGGDLGFFQKGQLIPEFEEVAFGMKKGEISPVFKTQFGYHIIKLTDRAEPSQRDLRSVKGSLEKQIVNDKRSKAYREFVTKLKGNAKIEINDQAIDAISISE